MAASHAWHTTRKLVQHRGNAASETPSRMRRMRSFGRAFSIVGMVCGCGCGCGCVSGVLGSASGVSGLAF